jgi:hypothetical protein
MQETTHAYDALLVAMPLLTHHIADDGELCPGVRGQGVLQDMQMAGQQFECSRKHNPA